MKKKLIGPLVTAVVVILLAGSFVYLHFQLNKMEKKAMEIRTSAVNDSAQISGIINFLNSNLNAQTNQ